MHVDIVDVGELVNKVVNSEVFKSWDSSDSYLVSCFYLGGGWNVGFYSKDSGKLTSFIVGEDIKIKEEEEVFQEEKKTLEELDIESVKVSLSDALVKVDELKGKKAEAEDVTSEIIILQQKGAPIWNITYTTSGFNLLNVKVDACSGEVLGESFSGIMELRKE